MKSHGAGGDHRGRVAAAEGDIGGNFVAVGVANSGLFDKDGDRQELLRQERDGGGPHPAFRPPSWSPDHRSFKSFVEATNSTPPAPFLRPSPSMLSASPLSLYIYI
ncbi:hypothetical protein ACFX2K_031829 [Malus domestica]